MIVKHVIPQQGLCGMIANTSFLNKRLCGGRATKKMTQKMLTCHDCPFLSTLAKARGVCWVDQRGHRLQSFRLQTSVSSAAASIMLSTILPKSVHTKQGDTNQCSQVARNSCCSPTVPTGRGTTARHAVRSRTITIVNA
jgi:hypothetical protein